jgi:predicted P-loop ATPase
VPISRHDGPRSVERNGKLVKLSPGKQPHGGLWAKKEAAVYGATEASVARWRRLSGIADHPGLGIACGAVVGADVDVYEPDLSAEIVQLVVERLGPSCLRRVGQAPKLLLVYRAAGEPIAKAMTSEFVKDGYKAKLEILGQGQQFVAAGIHPDTGAPYTWGKWSPDDVPLADLPPVTQEQVAELVAEAERRFRAAGYRTKAEIEAAAAPAPEPRANIKGIVATGKTNPFRTVNDAALKDLDRWVPTLFGDAARKDHRGVWRVSSTGLGRDREEDLSIAPEGIVDFGEHDMGDAKRGKRTAIDLVIEHGGAADASAAARWLADQLGIEVEIAAKRKAKAQPPDPEDDHPDVERWNEKLHRNDRGEARDIIANVALILRTDTRFKGNIRFNLMLEAVEARGLPWRGGGWAAWTDADDIFCAEWCQRRHAYVKRPTCAAAVQIVARDLQHHPIRERLNGLAWDGTARAETWLATYLGAADTAYTRAVGRAWLVSAVARVFSPGCKADHALILEGAQGAGKSTAAATIALEDAWFSDEIADLGTKDAAQDLRGKWIVELAELSALNRGAVERVKAFMSRRVDHYRPSYGTRSQDFPRMCAFIGSTNADAYLGDETGGRRFWPVKVGAIDIAGLKADRDQIWAEAVAGYRAGATWWLDRATEDHARQQQDARRIVDPWEELVLDWAEAQTGAVAVRDVMTSAIGIDYDRRDQHAQNRIARILKAAGWERKRDTDAGRAWRYHRPTGTAAPTPEQAEAARVAGAFVAASLSVPDSGHGVPVAQPHTGTEKASNSAPRPSVPVCPSVSAECAGASPTVARIDGVRTGAMRNLALKETTGTTGTDWDKLDHWRQQVGRTVGDVTARRRVARQWALAAGASIDSFGHLVLPADLPDGLAATDLRMLLRNLGMTPKVPPHIAASASANTAATVRVGGLS